MLWPQVLAKKNMSGLESIKVGLIIFLSARGYDMNKESKDWQERIKQQNLN